MNSKSVIIKFQKILRGKPITWMVYALNFNTKQNHWGLQSYNTFYIGQNCMKLTNNSVFTHVRVI